MFKYTRNLSGSEIANVNFLRRHRTRSTKYSRLVHTFTTDRRGYVVQRMFAKFSEITQCNGHYAVQGHSRSSILSLRSLINLWCKGYYNILNRLVTHECQTDGRTKNAVRIFRVLFLDCVPDSRYHLRKPRPTKSDH